MEALNTDHLDSMSLDSLWKNETFFLRWADKGLHQPVTVNPHYKSGYARSVHQPPCHLIQLTTRWLTFLTYGHIILVPKHYWCCTFTWCLSSWATLQEENPATLKDFGSRPNAVEVSPTTSTSDHSNSFISSSLFPSRKVRFDLPMTVVGRLLPNWNLTKSKVSLRDFEQSKLVSLSANAMQTAHMKEITEITSLTVKNQWWTKPNPT